MCGVRKATNDFITGKGSVLDMFVQLVRSDIFVNRLSAQ
jgi:hypothetical protein